MASGRAGTINIARAVGLELLQQRSSIIRRGAVPAVAEQENALLVVPGDGLYWAKSLPTTLTATGTPTSMRECRLAGVAAELADDPPACSGPARPCETQRARRGGTGRRWARLHRAASISQDDERGGDGRGQRPGQACDVVSTTRRAPSATSLKRWATVWWNPSPACRA